MSRRVVLALSLLLFLPPGAVGQEGEGGEPPLLSEAIRTTLETDGTARPGPGSRRS